VGIFDPADGLLAFTGSIDDVAVYDTVLSASEINSIFTQGVPEPSSAIVLVMCGAAVMIRARYRRGR
jgi:hypothetical protein